MFKRILMAALVSLAASTSALAISPQAQALGDCLYRNSTPEGRLAIERWFFVSMAQTEAMRPIVQIGPRTIETVTGAARGEMLRLVGACGKLGVAVQKKRDRKDALRVLMTHMRDEPVLHETGKIMERSLLDDQIRMLGKLFRPRQ